MNEVELKFQVPPECRVEVDHAVAGSDRPNRVRLQAAYFDTPDRALAKAGMALRVRREGRRWVQTLKGAVSDGMTRAEHNVPLLLPASSLPQTDPALHAGTAIGERLLALLKGVPADALRCAYRTDIHRRSRVLDVPGASVELAFDHGFIIAGEERVPVCELEIELLAGPPHAVIATARDWVAAHGLWLDTRTKAERGDMLARGLAMALVLRARPVELRAAMTQAQAQRAVLRECLAQVSVNASQVASGLFDDEHVHQLRVGLRRLRTALQLFQADALDATVAAPAAALFGQLGAARDAAAVAQPLAAALSDALAKAGLSLPELPHELSQDAAGSDPAAAVRAPSTQSLLLDLLTQAQTDAAEPTPVADEAPLREHLSKRLNRWHRQVLKDAQRFAELDDEDRHRLRKRVKRLRYSVEFVEALFARKAVRAYLKPLRALQERLGEVNDVVVGLAAYVAACSDSNQTDARALFAAGWLAARRDALIAACAPQLKAFTGVKRFWKK